MAPGQNITWRGRGDVCSRSPLRALVMLSQCLTSFPRYARHNRTCCIRCRCRFTPCYRSAITQSPSYTTTTASPSCHAPTPLSSPAYADQTSHYMVRCNTNIVRLASAFPRAKRRHLPEMHRKLRPFAHLPPAVRASLPPRPGRIRQRQRQRRWDRERRPQVYKFCRRHRAGGRHEGTPVERPRRRCFLDTDFSMIIRRQQPKRWRGPGVRTASIVVGWIQENRSARWEKVRAHVEGQRRIHVRGGHNAVSGDLTVAGSRWRYTKGSPPTTAGGMAGTRCELRR